MTRDFKAFQKGNYVKIDTPRVNIWRIIEDRVDTFEMYNPASGKIEVFYKEDLQAFPMREVLPKLLNWTSGEVIRDNREFIAGDFTINDRKFEMSCEKGTDNYRVTDGIEEFAFSYLHELQNFVKLKAAADLRFSSDTNDD